MRLLKLYTCYNYRVILLTGLKRNETNAKFRKCVQELG